MPAVMRLTRAGVLEVLSSDYIRTARAKGLRPRTVLNMSDMGHNMGGMSHGSGDMKGMDHGSDDMEGMDHDSGDMKGMKHGSGDMKSMNHDSGDMKGMDHGSMDHGARGEDAARGSGDQSPPEDATEAVFAELPSVVRQNELIAGAEAEQWLRAGRGNEYANYFRLIAAVDRVVAAHADHTHRQEALSGPQRGNGASNAVILTQVQHVPS